MNRLGDTIIVESVSDLENGIHQKRKGEECIYFLYKKPRIPKSLIGDLVGFTDILEKTSPSELVYVGVSRNYASRILKHRIGDRNNPKKDFDLAVVMFIGCRDRSMSLEQFFIEEIDPKYNKHSNGRKGFKSVEKLQEENDALREEINNIKKAMYNFSLSIEKK